MSPSAVAMSRRDVLAGGLAFLTAPSLHRLFAETQDANEREEITWDVAGKYRRVWKRGAQVSEEFFRRGTVLEWRGTYGGGCLKEQRVYLPDKRNVCTLLYGADSAVRATYLHDADQRETLGSFDVEKLTPEEYLKRLPRFLFDLRAIQIYIAYCYQYEEDPDNHYQTPEEMLRKTKEGKTRGDCEDLAFLMAAALRGRGVPATVIKVRDLRGKDTSSHAVCVVLEQEGEEGDGQLGARFHAISVCTEGVDVGGHMLLHTPDPPQPRTYGTRSEALNAVFPKYQRSGMHYSLSSDASCVEELGVSPRGSSWKQVAVRNLPVWKGSGER